MVFDTSEWRLVEVEHWALTPPEVESLRKNIKDSAMILHAIIMWGIYLQRYHIPEANP